MKYVPAKWQHDGRTKAIRLIVVHETISPEQGTGAEAVANYFERGERRASAHRVADSNSTVMCVPDGNTAFAAAGANSDGIHLELVGPGNQSERNWMDAFSKATIVEGGKSVREWSQEYAIPLRWLTVAEVADGVTKGLCTHDDVSHAFPKVSTGHSDPQNFPKVWALGLWTQHQAPAPITTEDDTMFTYEYDAAGAAPNVLVLVSCGKQVRITNASVLDRRRAAKETHLGAVDATEFASFERAFGKVDGL